MQRLASHSHGTVPRCACHMFSQVKMCDLSTKYMKVQTYLAQRAEPGWHVQGRPAGGQHGLSALRLLVAELLTASQLLLLFVSSAAASYSSMSQCQWSAWAQCALASQAEPSCWLSSAAAPFLCRVALTAEPVRPAWAQCALASWWQSCSQLPSCCCCSCPLQLHPSCPLPAITR